MSFHLFRKPDTNVSSPVSSEMITGDTEERQCAWCLADQGIPPGSGSHGICGFHASIVLQSHRDRAAKKRAAQ